MGPGAEFGYRKYGSTEALTEAYVELLEQRAQAVDRARAIGGDLYPDDRCGDGGQRVCDV